MNATELSEKDLQDLRESLLFQKSSILNKTHEFKEEQSNLSSVADEAEIASLDITTNISIHLHERDRTALYAIEKALGKIADGTYGQCEACSEMINARRLQARPFTALCIECMEEQESHSNLFQ
ncbi:TraR/DksA family transcriptional regulator [Bdellovibrio reynosensis]|uniref:TraR/DksA family transcriptional regulator n=1 Tax=Bdellovibrio reynosensis TaxID=2835041 RepID=A0ABY4C6D4_9BACT|nr:TraR/DksA family transcriptional regulator [Bdellovibrio reynosensis]UOF00438.1 TraR/DksA family transcriptional regulator [Bdellovibrio reynosensis]